MQFYSFDHDGLGHHGILSHYTMLSKDGNCTRLLKTKNKLKIGRFYK